MVGGTIEGTGPASRAEVGVPGFEAPELRDSAGPAAVEAYLDALDTASDEHAAQHRPPNTIRSHANGWQVWEAFCAEAQLPITAGARRGALRAFVHWLWEAGAAPSTIDSRVSAVAVTLRREHHVQVDREATAAARRLLTDYVREAAERGDPDAAAARPPRCYWSTFVRSPPRVWRRSVGSGTAPWCWSASPSPRGAVSWPGCWCVTWSTIPAAWSCG